MKAFEEIINVLNLSPHDEGGFFRQTYKSELIVKPAKESYARSSVTHIYYFLSKGMYSIFHKVKHDEIWNLYDGEGVKLYIYDAENKKIEERILSKENLNFHTVVPGNLWQAAEPSGDYVLVGCTVAPGWESEDEEYLSEHPEVVEKLGKLRPDLMRLI
jgi:predicted cupin superfamily sugar epimerase